MGFVRSLCVSSRPSTVWSDALNEARLSKQELDVQFDRIFQSWDSKPCGSRAVSSSASSRSNVKSCSFFAELLEAELERKSAEQAAVVEFLRERQAESHSGQG